jgi:hypothetical protein
MCQGTGHYRGAEKFTGKGRIFLDNKIFPAFADFGTSITGCIGETIFTF